MTEHIRMKGILSMTPGHAAGATCSCGWHSHTQSFEQHIEEVEADG
jgi:hypothetical protein